MINVNILTACRVNRASTSIISNDRKLNTELLNKFFKGQCSPEEAHQVLVWINSQEGSVELGDALEAFGNQQKEDRSIDSAKMLNRLHNQIKQDALIKAIMQENDEAEFKISARKSGTKFLFAKIAASIGLLLVTLFTIYFFAGQDIFGGSHVVILPDIQTKSTEVGQKLTVHLDDGSVAILNAKSSISYSKFFSDSLREVKMTGEVFFEVARDTNRPFVVSTSKLTTTALGTSFNIRAYENEEQAVSLVTGKVKVTAAQIPGLNYLDPGEEISYHQGSIQKRDFNLPSRMLWKEGVIYFNKTPLKECFRTLELWYGVEIVVTEPGRIKDRKVSGQFEKDYLTNVLKSLSYAHEFNYEIDQKRVYITFLK